MHYLNLVYDFDGTLSDSYPVFTEALLTLLSRYGLSDTPENALSLLKKSVSHALRQYPIPGDAEAVAAEFRTLCEEIGMEKQHPIDGAGELLETVLRGGGQNFLYTHSGDYVFQLLSKWGIRSCFTDFITAHSSFPRKPAPDALNYLIGKHALDRATTLMVGDRDIDILAGHNAGIGGILFDPDGYYPNAESEFRVTHLKDIVPIL